MSKRLMLPALALAALSLSACGSSSSSSSQTSSQAKTTPAAPSLSAFKAGFAKDKASFTKLGNDLGVAIQKAAQTSASQLQKEFSALSARTRHEGEKLAKLDPPAKYKAQLDKLVSDFGPVATDMDAIAKAAGTNDATAARKAAASLVRHSAALKTEDVSLTRALGLPQTG